MELYLLYFFLQTRDVRENFLVGSSPFYLGLGRKCWTSAPAGKMVSSCALWWRRSAQGRVQGITSWSGITESTTAAWACSWPCSICRWCRWDIYLSFTVCSGWGLVLGVQLCLLLLLLLLLLYFSLTTTRCSLQPMRWMCWNTSIVSDGEWVTSRRRVKLKGKKRCSALFFFFNRLHRVGDHCRNCPVGQSWDVIGSWPAVIRHVVPLTRTSSLPPLTVVLLFTSRMICFSETP